MSAGTGSPDDPGSGDPRAFEAAEYALGTLPAAERAAFERRLPGDPAAQAAVCAWERRLAPLSLAVPEERPPASVWEAIARALPGLGRTGGAAANDNRVRALTGQVRRWRFATAGAGLVAAGLALALALGPQLREPAGRYVAVVTSGGALPALIVTVDTATGTAQVRPVKAETPGGRSLQLWYIGADNSPKPLGFVGGQASRIVLPDAAKSGEGLIAVSVEPPGGSPTGQPTGQVIYTGQLIRD